MYVDVLVHFDPPHARKEELEGSFLNTSREGFFLRPGHQRLLPRRTHVKAARPLLRAEARA